MKIGKLLMLLIVVSGLFAFFPTTALAIDESEIITDPANDVYSFDYLALEEIGETNYITEHEDIEVKNIDIREVRYDRQDTSVTLKLKVEGEIEDRGNIFDYESFDMDFLNINSVAYEFILQTIDDGLYNDYTITYANKTCQLTNPDFQTVNISEDDFYIQNKDTLVINFELDSDNETYENLAAEATFMKFNLSEIDPNSEDFGDLFVILTDVAPNLPVEVIAIVTNLGVVGKAIDFNGSAWLGEPPYSYKWNFGDGSTSTQQSPTHIYDKPGKYEYNLTVTDNSGDSASYSAIIEISGNGGNGDNVPIIMFVLVIIIIAIIGIIAVVIIIRR